MDVMKQAVAQNSKEQKFPWAMLTAWIVFLQSLLFYVFFGPITLMLGQFMGMPVHSLHGENFAAVGLTPMDFMILVFVFSEPVFLALSIGNSYIALRKPYKDLRMMLALNGYSAVASPLTLIHVMSLPGTRDPFFAATVGYTILIGLATVVSIVSVVLVSKGKTKQPTPKKQKMYRIISMIVFLRLLVDFVVLAYNAFRW